MCGSPQHSQSSEEVQLVGGRCDELVENSKGERARHGVMILTLIDADSLLHVCAAGQMVKSRHSHCFNSLPG